MVDTIGTALKFYIRTYFEFFDKSESGKVVFFHTKFLKVSVVIKPFKSHQCVGLEILYGYSHLGLHPI